MQMLKLKWYLVSMNQLKVNKSWLKVHGQKNECGNEIRTSHVDATVCQIQDVNQIKVEPLN